MRGRVRERETERETERDRDARRKMSAGPDCQARSVRDFQIWTLSHHFFGHALTVLLLRLRLIVMHLFVTSSHSTVTHTLSLHTEKGVPFICTESSLSTQHRALAASTLRRSNGLSSVSITTRRAGRAHFLAFSLSRHHLLTHSIIRAHSTSTIAYNEPLSS